MRARKSHQTRLPRTRGTARKGGRPYSSTNISLRRPKMAARSVPGHWEGDPIWRGMSRCPVGALVERVSRSQVLAPGRIGAQASSSR